MSNIFIFLFGLLCGLSVTWFFELILKTNPRLRQKYYVHHKVYFGYHIHHSVFGLLFIILGIILFVIEKQTYTLFSIAMGTGIIILHTISDGRLVFIERENKWKHHVKK